MAGVGIPEGCREQHHEYPGNLDGVFGALERGPTGGRGDAAQDVQVRAGAEASAVEDGQRDRDGDALFDADECDREQGDQSQSEFEAVIVGDVDEIVDVQDSGGDEDQNRSQGRQGQVLEQGDGRDQQHEGTGSSQSGHLGPPGGRDHSGGSWGACVHREGADQAGDDIAGSDAEEVAIDVDLICALVGERAGRRGRLADNHQGDHAGDRRARTQRRPGQPVQPEVRRAVGQRTQHHHPVGVQLHRSDEDRRADQPDQRPRKPAIDPFGDDHDGEHADPDAQRPPVDQMQAAERDTHPVQRAAAGAGQAEQIR